MKKIFIIYLCSIIGINSFGQVSIGNALEPDSNVILDLTNFGNKGLLLPKTNTGPKKPLGNIFYDNSKVIIDCTNSKSIAYDVIEIIKDFELNAKTKSIEVEKINFKP